MMTMDQKTFKRLFFEKKNGRSILKCIQCGTCSGSCPFGNDMDHAPRELFQLIRDGEMEEVLRSNTPWYCVSCYQCMTRCPKEIAVTDLMYTLKEMAVKNGFAPSHKMPDLYKSFSQTVKRFGRVTESLVMAGYGIKHPLDAMGALPLAVKLMFRKRFEVLPQKIGQPEKMKPFLTAGVEKEALE